MTNGVNGHSNNTNGHNSRAPSLSGLSLTEYSANPSPPPGTGSRRVTDIVPQEFVLPNGHPDVRLPPSSSCLIHYDG